MATTTERILQSTGLNANVAAMAPREFGVSSDLERPAVGTTVAGTKFVGTEDYLVITTVAPAAIPILKRSVTRIYVDTDTAGGAVALDIRNGAQVAGYECVVVVGGATERPCLVTYASGASIYVNIGHSLRFLWTGAAWIPQRGESYISAVGDLVFTMASAAVVATRRVIALTGQVLTIASYPELCAAVYCGDANNPTADCFYKTSDAGGTTRSTSGTYMVMADARGLAIVGIGANLKITAANGSNYTGGSAVARYLTDMMQGHKHPVSWPGFNNAASTANAGSFSTGDASPITTRTTLMAIGNPSSDGIYDIPRTGAYTRGPSLGAQICIVY